MIEGLKSLFFPLEMISAAIVFSLPLEKRRHFAGRLAAAVGGFILLALLSGLWGARTGVETAAFPLISYLLFCVALLLGIVALIWFTRAVSLREAAYCGACAYLMEHVAYCIRLLFGSYVPAVDVSPGSPLHILIHALTYAVFYFAFARRMVKNRHYGATVLSSLKLTATVLAVVLVLSMLATIYGFEGLHAVYAIIFSIFAFYAQIDHQRELHLQSELEFQRELTARQQAQFEMSRENIELINHKCHDLKHQIAALKLIRDEKTHDAVIASLEDSVMIYDSMLKTGNDILDTVLTEKGLLCGHNGIILSCIADGTLLTFMEAVDLYTLFGNALDNAIEAVNKLPREARLIDLTVRDVVGMTIVKLENNFAGELTMADGLPETSKADKAYHGFGLRSIRSIAEKYGGLLRLGTEGGRFFLQITFPPAI